MITLTPSLYSTSKGQPLNLTELLSFKSQGFGENPAIYAQFNLAGHNGLDWGCPQGTHVYAAHDGIAVQGSDSSGGVGITVNGLECKTVYWHLSKIMKTGDVKAGDLIGLSGNTGFSTGPHLHFGLKLTDTNGKVLNRNNGFDGAVDPSPYLIWRSEYNDLMNTEQVTKIYVLAFYREPDATELAFWTGKSLTEFLTTAIKDRAQYLNTHV